VPLRPYDIAFQEAWMSRARLLVLVATLVGSLGAPPRLHAQLHSTGHYLLNQSSSLVAFTIYTQGLFRLKREGLFHDVAGELSYDPNRPSDTRVDVVVNTASVDMNNAEHNELLRSHEFFDAAEFPTMRFTSTATTTQPDGTMLVDGNLTIRGITKRVALPIALQMTQDGASVAARFDATFDIDRTEFGLSGVPKMKGFNISISKRVRIHVSIAAPVRLPGAP
jgi:polyisoprenoid-binding protein YceI